MEGLTFFDNFKEENIESIGLVFEPNFFTAYFYADAYAKKIAAYKVYEAQADLESDEIKNLKPLYALSTKGAYTLVPHQVFNEDDADTYLTFNTGIRPGESEWDRMIGLESIIVYETDKRAEKKVASVFPGLRLKHAVSSLLELCRHTQNIGSVVFLNQSHSIFDFVVFQNKKLILANSIETNHLEDVRYFLLFTLKTLGLKTDTPLYLLGAAVNNLELIELLKEYMPHLNKELSLHPQNVEIDLPDDMDFSFITSHWAGIYASICAL